MPTTLIIDEVRITFKLDNPLYLQTANAPVILSIGGHWGQNTMKPEQKILSHLALDTERNIELQQSSPFLHLESISNMSVKKIA